MPRLLCLLGAAVLLSAAACSPSSGDGPAQVAGTEESPFSVGRVPPGFEPAIAGRGSDR